MNYKAFATFTNHYIDAGRLPREARDLLPLDVRYKRNLYARDLPDEVLAMLWQGYRRALLPMLAQGKLGVILFQFPEWFPCSRASKEYLLQCQEQLPEFRIAVEFRNQMWLSERNQADTLAFLREHKFALQIVDQPHFLNGAMPSTVEATADIALVRLDGRNMAAWGRKDASAAERFMYYYTTDDFEQWVPQLQALAEQTRQVHVLLHNNYSNYSVTNAASLSKLVTA